MDENERELRDKIRALADKRIGGHDAESMRKLFLQFDSTGDGQLNWTETYELLTAAGVGNFVTRGAWVDGVFESLDKSPRDEKISWQEYTMRSSTPASPGGAAPGGAAPSGPVECSWEAATCDPQIAAAAASSGGDVSLFAWIVPIGLSVGMVWLITKD